MALDLVLHIGLPKTGTTAIQRTLAARRRALAAGGVCYPMSAVPALLHRAALAGDNSRGGLAPRVERFVESLRGEIAGLSADIGTVVLSAEQCSLFLQSRAQIGRLHALLAPHFAVMRVVVYLRRQDALAASLYGQMLRRGIIEAPRLDATRRELTGLYDYAALLGSWASVFGEDAIVPRIFARDRLPGGDVVRDFLAVCGADATLAGRRRGAANPSMDVRGQAVMLEAGRILQEQTGVLQIQGALWARLGSIVTELFPGRGWQPSRAAAAGFLAAYADSNDAVRRRWFPEQANLFDPDLSDLPEGEAAPEAAEIAAAACAVIVRMLQEMQPAEPAALKED